MKPIIKLICLICLFNLLPISAQANTSLNGIAVHSELGQDSFIGALYTSTPSTNSRDILISQQPKQIQVRILADRISARRFKRMWIEGMAINSSTTELQQQSKNMAAFSNMLKVSMKGGDIFAVQRSETSVNVIINGSPLGEIEDTQFFDLLLRAWIGPVPLSSQFRNDLLSGGDFSPTLQQLFNDTRPSDERIEAVAAALLAVEDQEKPEPARTPEVAVTPTVSAPTISAPTIIAPPSIPNVAAAPSIPQPSAVDISTDDNAADESEAETSEATDNTVIDADSAIANVDENSTKNVGEPVVLENEESIIEDDQEDFTAETLLIQQLYLGELKKWTYRELVYPQTSLNNDEQGVVRLDVIINRKGKVLETVMIEEAPYKRLNKAALTAIKKSSPYKPMPESIKGDTFTFSLPIRFKIVD